MKIEQIRLIFLDVLLIYLMKLDWGMSAPNPMFNMSNSFPNNNISIRNDHDDESSLLALKSSTMNDPGILILAQNWTRGTSFCNWIGVRCGSQKHPFRVTTLNLSSMGLEGSIPEEIGNLSFLKYLDLRNNSFSGPIPDGLGYLCRLRGLQMGENQLNGTIPWTLGKLKKLEYLFLDSNQLTETIPNSIFNISSLQRINLTNNQLSGNLPRDIGPNLRFLSLSRNKLSGNIPLGLLACAALEELHLQRNSFTGSIPLHIGNLSSLKILALHTNNLTGVIPTSIGNLSNLEKLAIGRNNIHGTISSEIGRLSELTWLDCALNILHGEVPPSVFNLTKLQVLELTSNHELFGELPSSIATGLPHLRRAYLSENRLRGMIPTSITNLSQLTILQISDNLFSGLIPKNLGNLVQLQTLYLGSNLFANNLSIPDQDFLSLLTNCKYLNQLTIEKNPLIKGELPRSFYESTNLSTSLGYFDASFCRLSGEIPSGISNLSSLIWLSIGSNDLVGEIPESLGSLTNLQLLEIYNNTLQGSIPQTFCEMKSLFSLTMSGNKLSGQLPLCLGNLASLREIYLTDNAFDSRIPSSLWFNGGIQKIYFEKNFFNGTLSPDLGNMRSLIELDISGNQLSGAIPDSIRKIQSLTILSLSDNMLNGPIPESFFDLKNLEYLDLSQNNLSGPIPMSLKSLMYLSFFNVSFNQLSGEIPNEGPFKNFNADCFMGNKDLCGAARLNVKACKLIGSRSSKNKSNIFLRYILPPVLAFSIFLAGVFLFFVVRNRSKKRSTTSSSLSDLTPGIVHERISHYDILRATNNLDETCLIGRGSFSSVYRGVFSDAMVAAVKVFNLDMQGAMKSFDTECQIMRSIRHRNLVKVITSCSNLDFKALVMEYMRNGNLDKWLYSKDFSLSISQRFRIMKDVAVALEYLHHGYSTSIVHCDLKPNNILLDGDMIAHVSDFGISKLVAEEKMLQQTKTLGTIGYMAPEYGSSGFISTAVDVYSYGILIIETFTRRKPTNEMFSQELTMKKWVSEYFPDSLMEIVDLELLNINEGSVKARHKWCLTLIIELALECIAEVPEERPTMKDVLVKIEKIKTRL